MNRKEQMNDIPVAITRCRSYDREAVISAVRSAWESIGIPELTGKRILVKPNILTDALPQKAVTTDPRFVEAVCTIILELGGKPMIGDSPGLHRKGFRPTDCGIMQICESLDIPWVDFTAETRELVNEHAVVQRSFTAASAALEADLIINLPKMKTHQLMYATGAVKNLFGLIPGLGKSPFHLRYPKRDDFADMLLDLHGVLPPVISIMDAVIAMEGPGPSSGTPKPVGAVLVSEDALALDLCMAYLMHEHPKDIPVLKQAHKRELLSSLDHEQLRFPLLRPEEVRPEHFEKIARAAQTGMVHVIAQHVRSVFTPAAAPAPIIDDEKCILCGNCAEICPAHALRIRGQEGAQTMSLDTDLCIRCYCCHEICPVQAMTVPGS